MKYKSILHTKLEQLYSHLINTFSCTKSLFSSSFHFILLYAKPSLLHLWYFTMITVFGYLALKLSKPRTDHNPSDFDLFFTSASATTISSLSTVEMEVFSNTQLVIMAILIFLGSEMFTSLMALQFRRLLLILIKSSDSRNRCDLSYIEDQKPSESSDHDETNLLHYNSIKSLGNVVAGYLLIGIVLGTSLVVTYIGLSTSAKSVLEKKGLVLITFSVFTSISTFTNCGFIPTNENMTVFRNNPGLLLILTPLSLIGGTLYPPCLRLLIWVMERFTKRKEYTFMLENYKELGYGHLISNIECWLLVGTVSGFLALQFVTFCVMEWGSGVMEGMSSYEKVVGSLFQTVNVRHAGESVVDISTLSSAVLVIFIVMMYFPPYTSILPTVYQEKEKEKEKEEEEKEEEAASQQSHKKGYNTNNNIFQNLLFSRLAFLTIFVILLCFTESKSLKDDPLNFNIISLVFEVVSACGSVGLSMGYSCERRLKTINEICIDKSYTLTGRFSEEGKFVIVLVMFYGRLKKFNIHGGKAWRLA